MVNERRNRIPQLWLWVLAGAALVGVLWFVVAVAPSLLIGSPPQGLSAADELKARNDVRATLVPALAGLAVAGGLVVTYRTYRQNRVEQDRTYERELYAKAVEQLGHEKAPVRLGALYSLERLAQDKPERRQTIVNVICAYLRMPFLLRAPEPTATGEQREPDAETETRADELGDTWRQERQVRLAAQRILAEHLHGDWARGQRSTDPPSSRFWPDIRLELGSATLIDFNLEKCMMADTDFRGASFSGPAMFGEASFSGSAGFDRAVFSGAAMFGGVTFGGDAMFGDAVFSRTAGFTRTLFRGAAGFDKVCFGTFARFAGATFSGNAGFREATFGRDARFDGATFRGNADFDRATFSGNAGFRGATFSSDEAVWNFGRSRVLRPDLQHVWPTGLRLGPDGSGGYTVVRADNGLDAGLKPEEPPAVGTAGGA